MTNFVTMIMITLLVGCASTAGTTTDGSQYVQFLADRQNVVVGVVIIQVTRPGRWTTDQTVEHFLKTSKNVATVRKTISRRGYDIINGVDGLTVSKALCEIRIDSEGFRYRNCEGIYPNSRKSDSREGGATHHLLRTLEYWFSNKFSRMNKKSLLLR